MTVIHVDTRIFRVRLPAVVLGRLGTSVVVQVTEQIELRVERRVPRRVRRLQHARFRAEIDDHRTRALADRPLGF